MAAEPTAPRVAAVRPRRARPNNRDTHHPKETPAEGTSSCCCVKECQRWPYNLRKKTSGRKPPTQQTLRRQSHPSGRSKGPRAGDDVGVHRAATGADSIGRRKNTSSRQGKAVTRRAPSQERRRPRTSTPAWIVHSTR